LTIALAATVLGFIVVDAGYLAFGARISPFTLGVILTDVALTIALCLVFLFQRDLREYLSRAGMLQGGTLTALAAELIYTAGALKPGAIAMTLAAVVVFCSRKRKSLAGG
jgi:hypothetical protein